MQRILRNILQAEIDPAFAARAKFILDSLEKYKPKRVLDAGCGRGFYLAALSILSYPKEIHGIDINEKYINAAKKSNRDKRIKIQKASIYSLPYTDNYFDAIICSEILEHLEHDTRALREIKRVLKKGGVLLISVPNTNFPFCWDPLNWTLMRLFDRHVNKDIWWLAGIWADHLRLYKPSEIRNLLSKAGFKVKKIRLFIRYCWPFSHFLLYGVGKNIIERLGVSEFNRFNFEANKSFSRLLAWVFRLPSLFENKNYKEISMCIALESVK